MTTAKENIKIRSFPPIKFKSVSIREDSIKEIDILSKTLLPKVNLSKAQTVTKILDIVKNSLEKKA